MRVITRTNDFDESFQIGTIVGFEGVNNLPMVELDGKICTLYAIVLPYSEELANLLHPMSNKEQWEWCETFAQQMRNLSSPAIKEGNPFASDPESYSEYDLPSEGYQDNFQSH